MNLEKSGIQLKDVNHLVGNPLREVDIETASGVIIQVKKLSSANSIIKQIDATVEATGQRTIGFIISDTKKADKIVNMASRHAEVTNNYKTLLELLDK